MDYFSIFMKIIKHFFRKLFNVKFLLLIIIIILLSSSSFGYTSYEYTDDIYNSVLETTRINQDMFVYMLSHAYYGNTLSWNNLLKPLLDEINRNQYDIYVFSTSSQSIFTSYVLLYHKGAGTGTVDSQMYLSINSSPININHTQFNNVKRYIVQFDIINNSHSVTLSNDTNASIPTVSLGYKSDYFLSFNELVYGRNTEEQYLADLNTSLSGINTVSNDILIALNSLSQTLLTIQNNTSINYSNQIGQISSKINDILTDNDTIISQNSSMIEQQEEINDNLEQVSSDIQDVKDTLTDDTVESSASDLPSTDVSNPTEEGIDNIFTSIYNAFCVGTAQDIIFPIPFTNKNITLSPYYVRDMLNNNNAGWIYTLIQAFWGYLIGRFIVSDISKKIDKIKSGNIENVENSNIKEEML